MAPGLITLPASAFTATYSTPTKTLKLQAKGKIRGFWSNPFLRRENFTGGLKYSFLGYPLGLGPPKPDYDIDIDIVETITLPLRSFNSTDLLVETGNGAVSVPIKYDVSPGPGTGGADKPSNGSTDANHSDVLPPIKKFLPMGELLIITATIPTGRRSGVVPRYNEDYFRLVYASATDNQITWAFKWAKAPDSKANPQLIEVQTDQWNGEPPPNSQTSHIVQGYVVGFVVLSP